ncbi:MAG: hypothetical protein C4562_02150 [Actinobacteria bacterium]|nr:MAG: hypothetical protein C4562_02150 [Actinomycetota bacterium]
MARFRLPDLSDPKKKASFVLMIGAALVVLLFVVAIAIPVFSNPTFCGLICHSQKADVLSWEKSSHANVTCYACHMQPGLLNMFYMKAKDGVLGGYYEVSGNYHKPINGESEYAKELPSVVCERCHNMANRSVTSTEGIIINHKVHLDKNINCTICHNRVAHKRAPEFFKVAYNEKVHRTYEDFMEMEGCFRCHASKKKQKLSELSEEIEENGWEEAPPACIACHPKNWEKLPVGHTTGWRKNHKIEANKNINACYKVECHTKESLCNDCHEE